MITCRLRRRRVCTLLTLVALLLLVHWLFRSGPSSTPAALDIQRLARLLEPVFSTRSDRHRITPHETLQARVLQAETHCQNADPPQHDRTVLDGTHPKVHWCIQPFAISNPMHEYMRAVAQRNLNSEPRLDRSSYYSLSERNGSSLVTLVVVQHPLLRLVTAFQQLQHQPQRSSQEMAPATFPDFVQLILHRSALDDSVRHDDRGSLDLANVLQVDYCQFCRTQYDFILDGMALESEIVLLINELFWQKPETPRESERLCQLRLLEEAADFLAKLSVIDMKALEMYFKVELDLYGYQYNFKQIHHDVTRQKMKN